MTDTKIDFNVNFTFANKHIKGETRIEITDGLITIKSQDQTLYEHTLVIDHDDFKHLISLYEKASKELNELYDSVKKKQPSDNVNPNTNPEFKIGDKVRCFVIDGVCEVIDIFHSNTATIYHVREYTDHSRTAYVHEDKLFISES